MAKYLSIDIESTGLEENCHLIEIAFIPLDTEENKLREEDSLRLLVGCPSFEELKPVLNSWVKKHNKRLIEDAHQNGIPPEELPARIKEYLESKPLKEFFGDEPITLLGKSLSALDIPMMNRYLGGEFMRETFHHHTADVTCFARALVDAGMLPPAHASGSKLIKYFEVGSKVQHTALDDARDMALIYLKLLEHVKKAQIKAS